MIRTYSRAVLISELTNARVFVRDVRDAAAWPNADHRGLVIGTKPKARRPIGSKTASRASTAIVRLAVTVSQMHRGVLTSAGAEEVCQDLCGDKRALNSERRRKQAAVALLHVDRARGRAVDLTASQQQILDLRMANAFRSASTHADPDNDAS